MKFRGLFFLQFMGFPTLKPIKLCVHEGNKILQPKIEQKTKKKNTTTKKNILNSVSNGLIYDGVSHIFFCKYFTDAL